MDRVLITGASGFVGFHLIEQALKSNLQVYAAVRKSSDISHLKHLDIQFTYPNFNDVDALVKELEDKQYKYIIHAAGLTKAKSQQDYDFVNATYTYNLAQAAVKANIALSKFVFLSSLAAMGPSQHIGGMIYDNTVPAPVTAYGKSKLHAEQLLASLPNLPLITIRPTAVYGPRDKDIFIVLKKFSQGIEPYIGKIAQELSFIYVTDLAAIAVKALASNIAQKAYNVSDGQAYSRYALADYTKQILRKKTVKLHLPIAMVRLLAALLERVYAKSKSAPALNIEKLNELTATSWICDIKNITTDLGYQPQYNLQQGLSETLQWYKAQGWL